MLYFDYRGSWGSPGDFSFSHSIEDTAAAIAYLRRPETAKLLRLDPSRIVFIGHSMGGFMAVQGPRPIQAVGLISAADLGGRLPHPLPEEREHDALQSLSAGYAKEGMAPLAGCTPDGLAREAVVNTERWKFVAKVEALKSRPVLVVSSEDRLAPANAAFASALTKAGDDKVTQVHLPTDHSYSDQRDSLAAAVLRWLVPYNLLRCPERGRLC